MSFTFGQFVTSSESKNGIGKVVESNSLNTVVEFFDSPISVTRPRLTVSTASLSRIQLDLQSRVYFIDHKIEGWRVGRIRDCVDEKYYLALPNQREITLHESEVYIRWNNPIIEPYEHLAARVTETPYFHDRRAPFIRALVEQRASASGLTGLISAPIDLERHQVEVVRRVLQDPVTRYLLADEVGLGKTIEAGIIIRQHILDYPESHCVLIAVPAGLEDQWQTELEERCQVGELFRHRIEIITFEAIIKWTGEMSPTLVVVDEAHQAVRGWNDAKGTVTRDRFERLRDLTVPTMCPRLLLLSATPVRRNEEGFLALLHLLDPAIHRLEDLDGFRAKVAARQDLAELYFGFTEDIPEFFLRDTLDRLRALFPEDSRLSSLLDAVEQPAESETRARCIRIARTHLSETYRLHRRLIRNRRSEELEGLLPGRDGLIRVEVVDETALHLEAALEAWRAPAAAWAHGQQPEIGQLLARVFITLIEAAWSGTAAFLSAITLRLSDQKASPLRTPLFPGEPDLLREMETLGHVLQKKRGFQENSLGQIAVELLAKGVRVVLIATNEERANQVYSAFAAQLGKGVARHRPGDKVWRKAWTDGTASVLVCDARAEEGLNLQGGRTAMVHIDVPLSPNRLEQRLGRLDRIGSGHPVRSYVVMPTDCPLQNNWLDCLDQAWRVFSRSIASLQYLVEDEMATLREALFFEGPPAFTTSIARMSGDRGIIEKELRALKLEDQMDACEDSIGNALMDRIEKAEEQSAITALQTATEHWLVDTLQFQKVCEPSSKNVVISYHYRHARRKSPSLMGVNDFIRRFSQCLDPRPDVPQIQRPLTWPIAFSRETARHRSVGVARLGNPLIDALETYLAWDDRGSCFGMWRKDESRTELCPAAYFRFDFIIETDISEVAAFLRSYPELSLPSLRRACDAAFPPIIETVWIDQQLSQLDDGMVAKLERPFNHDTDVNLNSERWPVALSQIPDLTLNAWASLCEAARDAAERVLRGRNNLITLTERCACALEADGAMAREQAESRIAALASQPDVQECQRKELNFDRQLTAILACGIRKPTVRSDSAGSVFLAGSSLNLTPIFPGDE